MVCAGIDTGKHKLDVALEGGSERLTVTNTADGHGELSAWLRQHRVKRVGIEASGGYEHLVVAQLRRDGFTVIVFQPAQVRAYAQFLLQRAKNDRIDAALIAGCTAATSRIHPPPDPRLAPFAEALTLIEQLTDDIARCKTRREPCRDARLQQFWSAEVVRLKAILRSELAQLEAAIRQHRDLATRLDLIASVQGIGMRTAIAILVRMPEIGRVSREHIAALAGLAPYDDDSADRQGERHIDGGRERLRHSLFPATVAAAHHWNPQLIAVRQRLIAKGKPHKVAIIACARKLLIYANTVVARGTPWQPASAP
jgi:transposase